MRELGHEFAFSGEPIEFLRGIHRLASLRGIWFLRHSAKSDQLALTEACDPAKTRTDAKSEEHYKRTHFDTKAQGSC